MARALQEYCGDVSFLGPIQPPLRQFAKLCSTVLQNTIGKRYLYTHSIWLSKQIARIVKRKLAEDRYDLIFAPAGSTEVAYLDTNLPVCYLSDATVSLITNYYPEFSHVLGFSLREAEHIEQRAISKATVLFYSSQWAARSAVGHYRADESRVHVVPFGANLHTVPDRDALFNRQPSERCRLLFVGVDWERKGGEIAYRTMLALEERGLNPTLTVVGCIPPRKFRHQRMTIIPFLDKNKVSEQRELFRIYMQSDFLISPTRMDCTPMVFPEANAFGLPVIATDTGGVASVITDGENGYLFPPTAPPDDYADSIAANCRDQQRYLELRTRSRQAFESKLNWKTWAEGVRSHLPLQ
jgi:glycosyltransferase involved in cell wall biosynthesis